MDIIKKIISGWTVIKFIRVLAGGLILYSSIESYLIAGIILGAVFLVISLVADGSCCAMGSVSCKSGTGISSSNENIEYEEVGSKE